MSQLKLRYPQPQVPPGRLREKLNLSRMYVSLTRELYEMAFPKRSRGFGSDVETLLVLLCVFIGEADGRPTTPTKLALHSGLSRPTVYRRLDQLMQLKKVVRIGHSYHIAEGAAAFDKNGRLAKILDNFANT